MVRMCAQVALLVAVLNFKLDLVVCTCTRGTYSTGPADTVTRTYS